MTNEKVEKALDLEHNIAHVELQIRKAKETIAFLNLHGKEYHYHLEAKTFGLTKWVMSWHFLPDYLLEMLTPQLAKWEAELETLQAEFAAL